MGGKDCSWSHCRVWEVDQRLLVAQEKLVGGDNNGYPASLSLVSNIFF